MLHSLSSAVTMARVRCRKNMGSPSSGELSGSVATVSHSKGAVPVQGVGRNVGKN